MTLDCRINTIPPALVQISQTCSVLVEPQLGLGFCFFFSGIAGLLFQLLHTGPITKHSTVYEKRASMQMKFSEGTSFTCHLRSLNYLSGSLQWHRFPLLPFFTLLQWCVLGGFHVHCDITVKGGYRCSGAKLCSTKLRLWWKSYFLLGGIVP